MRMRTAMMRLAEFWKEFGNWKPGTNMENCRFRGLMARPGGLEPPTHSLEGCCSVQLS
jgi:hypothetical protein